MTAWWAPSSIPTVSTTQSGLSGFSGDCRERPAIGGYFSSAIFDSLVSTLKSSHFGPVSLVRKFPFLASTSWDRTGWRLRGLGTLPWATGPRFGTSQRVIFAAMRSTLSRIA
jgi:hypothetical protein